MKILYSLFALVVLLQEGNAFSFQQKNGGQTNASTSTSTTSRKDFLQLTSAVAFASLVGASVVAPEKSVAIDVGGRITYGSEAIMNPKEHGTSAKPVQSDLLYGVNNKLADKICSYNRYVL